MVSELLVFSWYFPVCFPHVLFSQDNSRGAQIINFGESACWIGEFVAVAGSFNVRADTGGFEAVDATQLPVRFWFASWFCFGLHLQSCLLFAEI